MGDMLFVALARCLSVYGSNTGVSVYSNQPHLFILVRRETVQVGKAIVITT